MRIRTSAMFMALWLVCTGVASAQVTNTGTIQIVVTDADGGRLPGVTVTATAADTITFGYSQNPGSNFVIGTLAGGERNFQGLEFVFRKRFANNWQMLTSHNWNDAEGNTNSDSNADFQGDVDFLDPRAQGAVRNQDLVAGSGGKAFGDPILWVNPRRAFVGARVKF